MDQTSIFLTTNEAAQFLRLSPRTLEKWRVEGSGPIFRKLGRKKVVYTKSDLVAWTETGLRLPTADPSVTQKEIH